MLYVLLAISSDFVLTSALLKQDFRTHFQGSISNTISNSIKLICSMCDSGTAPPNSLLN